MSEHVVASFRMETDDAPLFLDFVTKVSPKASVATEEDFASFKCASTLGDFASISDPSEDGFTNTTVVSPLAFSSGSRLLPGCSADFGWTNVLSHHCNHRDEVFDAWDSVGVPPDGPEWEEQESLQSRPSDRADGESSAK